MQRRSTKPRDNSTLANGCVKWMTVDGVRIPCVVREKLYGPVRVLEEQLLNTLSTSSGAVNDAFQSRRLLVSKYLTASEAADLTCAAATKYGPFTCKDLVVDIDEFLELFRYLKSLLAGTAAMPITGGWVQINNSVIPYVNVNQSKLLPLAVVVNAAGLLCNVAAQSLNLCYPRDAECLYLNDLCRSAGLEFEFHESTPLVDMMVVSALTSPTPYVRLLPSDDPFSHAQFIDDGTQQPAATSIPTVTPAVDSSWYTNYAQLDALNRLTAAASVNAVLTTVPPTPQMLPQAIGTVVSSSGQPRPPAAPAPPTASIAIEPVLFRNRTISSLRRPADSNHYVLLDAVCRVFFPHQRNADAFVRSAEALFRIPDVRMTADEEQQFIRFYQLPADRLRCNKLIALDQLTDVFPRLEMMFSTGTAAEEGQLIGTVIPRSPGDGVASAGGHTTTTNNNNNNNKRNNDIAAAKPRKRRRNDVCPDVVVID